MDAKKFSKVSQSLRKFQRAELKDFEDDLGKNPIEKVYVDPLDDNAVLDTVLSGNTTFLFGRKGTGKSTIIARAQSEIRKGNKSLSAYVDVKSINEASQTSEILKHNFSDKPISNEIISSHILRKTFLIEIFSRIIDEIDSVCKTRSLVDRIFGSKKKYDKLKKELLDLRHQVRSTPMQESEVPILASIETEVRTKHQQSTENSIAVRGGAKVGVEGASVEGEIKLLDLEEVLDDDELYERYSKAVLRTFPYQEFINKLTGLLEELSFSSLIIFFDDFSELSWSEQRLFVDIILAPLNNTSDERVKLKVAAYPGRSYYGNIDPGKIDVLKLDFYDLYQSSDFQTMESKAIAYTERLLTNRFLSFGIKVEDYFSPAQPMSEYYKLMFRVSFNVPRLMGHILHTCYVDQVSRREKITLQSIRLASKNIIMTN